MDALPHRAYIAKEIRRLIRDGVGIRVIIDSIQKYDDAPKSLSTMYKIYGQDIAEERASFQSYLGGKAREHIENGSERILELALRSKAGWNPTEKVQQVDDDDLDENTSAIEELMGLLGKR